MTEQDILDMTRDKALMYKSNKDKTKKPEFNEIYRKTVELRDHVLTHSVEDYFPEHLYLSRAPNQTDQEIKYIKDNHKAITFKVWLKYMSVINRIWNDQNWTVKDWGKVDAKFISAGLEPQKYFEEEYPEFGSLEEFFKTVFTEVGERDANAVYSIRPDNIPIKVDAIGMPIYDQSGDVQIDDTIAITPVVKIWNCEQIISFDGGEYCLLETLEKSKVIVGDQEKWEGLVYEFYDKNSVYLISQYGKKSDYLFDIKIYWTHNLGYLPAKKMGGRVEICGDNLLYKSNFLPACDYLDLALLDNSNLIVSKARHTFPKAWEYMSKCDFMHPNYGLCNHGVLNDDGKPMACPSCKGTGYSRSLSPFQTMAIPIPDSSQGAMIPAPPGGYITPEIETPKFLREEIVYHIDEAESILNINYSSSNVKGNDTALGKQIDREQLFAFLINITTNKFGAFAFCLKTIQKMRYGNNAEGPNITKPNNFAIRTTEDLILEISAAKSQGLPDIVVRQLIVEFIGSRFANYEKENKLIHIVFYTDRLATLSNLEILAKKNAGTVAIWEEILHTSVYNFIEEAMIEDVKFFEKTLDEQKQILIDKAKLKQAEIMPAKINTGNILSNANSAAVA